MPVIVVTRLRLRDPALLDEFFTDAVAAIEQAMKSEGNLGADALADANNAWWSVSAWQERGLMRAFVDSEPHLGISARLDHYCDEAMFVDWDQASADLPDWQTSWRHLTADGKAAELTHPSAANQTHDFPGQSSHLPASPEVSASRRTPVGRIGLDRQRRPGLHQPVGRTSLPGHRELAHGQADQPTQQGSRPPREAAAPCASARPASSARHHTAARRGPRPRSGSPARPR